MKVIHLLLVSLLVTAASAYCLPSDIASNYQLIWQDEFNENTLNSDYWDYVTGVRRDAMNTADAVAVANGNLVITTYTTGTTNYTGFIQTKEKFLQPFGYYEARIKFNDASGMWSAFWLMPYNMEAVTDSSYIGRPDISGVEVDVIEHRMKQQDGTSIENVVNSGLHWDGYGQ